MTIIQANNAVCAAAQCYDLRYEPGWRTMYRVDSVSARLEDVAKELFNRGPFEKLVYAEGDSWFDKFTPLFEEGTNFLDAVRVPFRTAVVDVSHIGDVASEMVSGQQRKRTVFMFEQFDFDAILFSGGGNDLKNLFAGLYDIVAEPAGQLLKDRLQQLKSPRANEFFDEVIANICSFVGLRNASPRKHVRNAPIFVNGYDYLQPRPIKGAIFGGALKVAGPWLYPSMRNAGLTDAEMLSAVQVAIDTFNQRLQAEVATLSNVFVIDQRGLLTPAIGGSTTPSEHWLDEIHPSAEGFTKLSRNRWDGALARALGWQPRAGETTVAADFQ